METNHGVSKPHATYPIPSMYGIFTYIWLICMVNVGKYTIHGWYGYVRVQISFGCIKIKMIQRIQQRQPNEYRKWCVPFVAFWYRHFHPWLIKKHIGKPKCQSKGLPCIIMTWGATPVNWKIAIEQSAFSMVKHRFKNTATPVRTSCPPARPAPTKCKQIYLNLSGTQMTSIFEAQKRPKFHSKPGSSKGSRYLNLIQNDDDWSFSSFRMLQGRL